MSLEAAILLSFVCIFLGINTTIAYYYIYKGIYPLRLTSLLKKNGQIIDARITKKYTNTMIKSEDETTKTKYYIAYSFCYQNKQCEKVHNIPNTDYCITFYNSLQIGEYIQVSFYSKNPSKYNLPLIAMDYSIKKYIIKILIGTAIFLFGMFLILLLIYLLYDGLNNFISGYNLFAVFIGYPLLIVICAKNLNQYLTKSNKKDDEKTEMDEMQQFVETQETQEIQEAI